MKTSGPLAVLMREQVAEEGEGGGSIDKLYDTYIHTYYLNRAHHAHVCLPLISLIYIALLVNGRRLQSIFDPFRRDASPLNVEDTL